MIRTRLSILFIIFSFSSKAGTKIKYYFNHPVDNSLSTTINAMYLSNCVADTLVAYINRAKYSIDIAQYDYNQGNSANIATAINNAYSRGVQVRWIYDGSSPNTALSLLNSSIHTLGSPTSNGYGIMHNKFVTIDANSSDPSDPLVWTGSFDWSDKQFNTDHNNVIIIQDSALVQAYTAEFNIMWGGTGIAPNISSTKFGPHKPNLGNHLFTIEGNLVELYFSPSDGTDSHIQSTISSANTDMYFGMYTFTGATDASLIVNKYNSGVYVAGINDSYSNSYSPYATFTSGLGANFKVYNSPGIYHNKFLIVDPSDKCSDPTVLTGSHNWTTSANTLNDENTLIIHNDTAANVYAQSFHADFISLGGLLSPIAGCTTSVPIVKNTSDVVSIFPNPTNGALTIRYELTSTKNVSIEIYNVTGQKATTLSNMEAQKPGSHNYEFTIDRTGLYFIKFILGNENFTKKVFVAEK